MGSRASFPLLHILESTTLIGKDGKRIMTPCYQHNNTLSQFVISFLLLLAWKLLTCFPSDF